MKSNHFHCLNCKTRRLFVLFLENEMFQIQDILEIRLKINGNIRLFFIELLFNSISRLKIFLFDRFIQHDYDFSEDLVFIRDSYFISCQFDKRKFLWFKYLFLLYSII